LPTESEGSHLPKQDACDHPGRGAAEKKTVSGALWCIGGIALTLFSYLAAASSPTGGHYVIAWGAIVFGAMRFFRSRAVANGRSDRKTQAQLLLHTAARLESVNGAKATALYAEIVQAFPGTRASEEAQRNIQTLKSHGE